MEDSYLPSSKPEGRNSFLSKKTTTFLISFISILAIIVLISGITFFYFFSRITNISIERERNSINIPYTQISRVLEYAKGKNIFFVSTDFLEKEILIRFPEIENIKISRKFPNTLEVSAHISPMIIHWKYQEKNTEKEGYINKNGIFFPSSDSEELFTIIDTNNYNQPINKGEEIFNPEYISEILNAKETLESLLKINISQALYLRKSQEIHFETQSHGTFWLFLSNEVSLIDQIKKFEQVINQKNIYENTIDYIDLRISGKVFYTTK